MSFPSINCPVLPVEIRHDAQVTVDVAAAAGAFWTAPFKGRVIRAEGFVRAIGGTVDPTDLDLDVKVGAASKLASAIPAVESSAIVKTVTAHVDGHATAAGFAKGDRLDLDINVTGGTAPTADGVGVRLWVVREE